MTAGVLADEGTSGSKCPFLEHQLHAAQVPKTEVMAEFAAAAEVTLQGKQGAEITIVSL